MRITNKTFAQNIYNGLICVCLVDSCFVDLNQVFLEMVEIFGILHELLEPSQRFRGGTASVVLLSYSLLICVEVLDAFNQHIASLLDKVSKDLCVVLVCFRII